MFRRIRTACTGPINTPRGGYAVSAKKIPLTNSQLLARGALVFLAVFFATSLFLIALVEYLMERNLP
jgi:hypothetical protein